MKTRLLLIISTLFFSFLLQACDRNETKNEATTATEPEKSVEIKEEANKTEYPQRNIEIVVGYGEGGGTDIFARAVAKPMSKTLNTTINVVNKPGASGLIAENYVWNQPADGYTIWAITPDFLVNIAKGESDHNLDDYIPIGRAQFDTYALQVKTDSPYNTLEKLLEAAKENPGTITIGGTASDGFDELSARRIQEQMGIELRYVPYDQVGLMHSDVLGGHLDVMLEEVGPTISQIEAGNLTPIILFADTTVEGFEDTPLGLDHGWDFNDGNQRSFLVKADTPQDIIAVLEQVFHEALDDEDYLRYIKQNYLDLRDGYLNSADLNANFEENLAVYKKLLNP